jgi:hypothetical protein
VRGGVQPCHEPHGPITPSTPASRSATAGCRSSRGTSCPATTMQWSSSRTTWRSRSRGTRTSRSVLEAFVLARVRDGAALPGLPPARSRSTEAGSRTLPAQAGAWTDSPHLPGR